jgi:outer membrane protein OmpA-like peptidoglycan-associated protein
MKIFTTRFALYFLVGSCIIMSGCGARKMQRGAAIGAGAGATVGALIGKTAGNTALGTIIGGAVGGTAGAYIGHKMDNVMAEDKPVIKDASVSHTDAGYLVKFDKDLQFDKGSSDVNDKAQKSLKNLAAYLKQVPQANVFIVGYTDTLEIANYSVNLSLQRAEAVKMVLVADSVSANRLSTKGKAGAYPIADNNKPDGQAKNRRVEIVVITNDKAQAKNE